MRMWGIPPEMLCDQHLLGEHVELHMLVGTLKRGISVQGYIESGLVELDKIGERHEILVQEMKGRGMNHESDLKQPDGIVGGRLNLERNVLDLATRCLECQKRILNAPASVHQQINRS